MDGGSPENPNNLTTGKPEKGTRFVSASRRPSAHKDLAHSTNNQPSVWQESRPVAPPAPKFGQASKPIQRSFPGQTPEPLGLGAESPHPEAETHKKPQE